MLSANPSLLHIQQQQCWFNTAGVFSSGKHLCSDLKKKWKASHTAWCVDEKWFLILQLPNQQTINVQTHLLQHQLMSRHLPTQDPSWTLRRDTGSRQEESVFTLHRIHHVPVRWIADQPPSSVSTCHLTHRPTKIIWWQRNRGQIYRPSRSSKSLLFISGTFLKWLAAEEAKDVN